MSSHFHLLTFFTLSKFHTVTLLAIFDKNCAHGKERSGFCEMQQGCRNCVLFSWIFIFYGTFKPGFRSSLVSLTISGFLILDSTLRNSIVKFSCHLTFKSLKNILKDLDSDLWEAILGLATKEAVPWKWLMLRPCNCTSHQFCIIPIPECSSKPGHAKKQIKDRCWENESNVEDIGAFGNNDKERYKVGQRYLINKMYLVSKNRGRAVETKLKINCIAVNIFSEAIISMERIYN